MPTFYDKLLQVPVLNLSIKLIDRAARSNAAASARSRSARPMAGAAAAPSGIHVGLGDRVCGDERGARRRRRPSRASGCRSGSRPARSERPYACPYLARRAGELLRSRIGLGVQRARHPPGPARAPIVPARWNRWQRGCELGFSPACVNAGNVTTAGDAGERAADAGRLPDHPAGEQRTDHRAVRQPALYALACRAGLARHLPSRPAAQSADESTGLRALAI